jgi:hypothetical protein
MRRLLALTIVAAAAATAAPAFAADDARANIVPCIVEHNRIPDPGYGGWDLNPVETVQCWLGA